MIDRLPPQSLSSEQAFLGACLYDPEIAVEDGAQIGLKPSDFYEPTNGLVWKAILFLYDLKKPIDVVTVSDVLQMSGRVDSPQTFVIRLSALHNGTASHARAYAETIKKKAVNRELIRAAGRIADIGYDDPSDVQAALDKADETLRRVYAMAPKPADTPDPEDIIRRMENPATRGILTRFPILNAVTGGMDRGQIWIIGGFTSTGKSAVIVNLLEDAVRAGRPAMVASLEMTSEQYMARGFSITSGISQSQIKNGGMSLEQSVQYGAARDFWLKAPVRIYDRLTTVAAIAREAQAVKRSMGLDILFVDYIQQLSDSADETNDIRVAVKQFQDLAKELDCCIVLLSQISNSQAFAMAANGMQDIYTFKGTGAISQVADVAIMLERSRTKAPDVMWFHIAKNRHGDTPPKFAARFDLPTGTLTQMSGEETFEVNPNRGRRNRPVDEDDDAD